MKKLTSFIVVGFLVTLGFVVFQNCAGGFQVVAPGVSNLDSSTTTTTMPTNVSAQCSIGPAPSAKLSGTCFKQISSVNPPSNVYAYEPQYPAYSDGATKNRWLYLPVGTKINSDDPDNWIFPKGTVIFKEFSIDSKKIETRVLEKVTSANGPNAWRFSNYAWTTDQTEAELVTAAFYTDMTNLQRFSANSVQQQYKVSMPNACTSCHSGATDVVNGFNYLQLSSDLVKFNVLQAAPILTNPPSKFDMIQGSTLDQTAIGYIQSNCAICHGSNGPGTGNFRHSYMSTSLANENIMLTSNSLGLIVNGQPNSSLLYTRFASGSMPQVMPVKQDSRGHFLMYTWISSL